jgi:hypothetical protein
MVGRTPVDGVVWIGEENGPYGDLTGYSYLTR